MGEGCDATGPGRGGCSGTGRRGAGTWYRHVGVRWAHAALTGRAVPGRWCSGGYPTLYLASTVDSAVIEFYRHTIDVFVDAADRDAAIAGVNFDPRLLVTAEVRATRLLDLRSPRARLELGLPLEVLLSDTDDRGSYARCQEVASAAHQLQLHGVITPAATRAGDTLALFTDVLPAAERPTRDGDLDKLWSTVPLDPRAISPRRLRVVHDSDGSSRP